MGADTPALRESAERIVSRENVYSNGAGGGRATLSRKLLRLDEKLAMIRFPLILQSRFSAKEARLDTGGAMNVREILLHQILILVLLLLFLVRFLTFLLVLLVLLFLPFLLVLLFLPFALLVILLPSLSVLTTLLLFLLFLLILLFLPLALLPLILLPSLSSPTA